MNGRRKRRSCAADQLRCVRGRIPVSNKIEFSYLNPNLMVPKIPPATLTLCQANTDGSTGKSVKPQEVNMQKYLRLRPGQASNRCAICDGRFGLIRHYSWQTALCSRKCVDRFATRKESDRRWLLPMFVDRQSAAVGMTEFRSEETA